MRARRARAGYCPTDACTESNDDDDDGYAYYGGCDADDSKCSSSGSDCCACDESIGMTSCGWDEDATCDDGYVAIYTGNDGSDCQYSCYPPGCSIASADEGQLYMFTHPTASPTITPKPSISPVPTPAPTPQVWYMGDVACGARVEDDNTFAADIGGHGGPEHVWNFKPDRWGYARFSTCGSHFDT